MSLILSSIVVDVIELMHRSYYVGIMRKNNELIDNLENLSNSYPIYKL